jgi:hypothetical protein
LKAVLLWQALPTEKADALRQPDLQHHASHAKLTIAKHGQIKGMLPGIAGHTALTERQDGREDFRCPEYRLLVECLFRIGREKTAPIFAGTGEVSGLIARPMSDF